MKQLSEIYKTSRQTMYEKSKHPDLQQFIVVEGKGRKLLPEGLNVLNVLMADSRVKLEPNKQIDASVNEYLDKYIKSLQSQIEVLMKDKELLQATVNDLIVNQRMLLAPPEKKGFIAKWFKK